jgi:hypothetical protein
MVYAMDANWSGLAPRFREALERVFEVLRGQGFRPVLFEGRRSMDRQRWLYAIGRTREKHRKPVTWTLHSRHLSGFAADVVSRDKWWSDPPFFAALREVAVGLGLEVLDVERCHVQAPRRWFESG